MKLMKATLRRLWRLTRATSVVVGLAVMVALVGGVVSLGLAKPPADGTTPPGGETAVAILKGVENTATTVTTLINSGTGAALNLVVGAGEAPLTVSPGAGTATGLSADTVDGKDSTDFVSATDGKAPDSELLDGIDSTKFAQVDADGKVANSDKLDGKDSTDFAAASTGTAYTAKQATNFQGRFFEIPNGGNVDVVSKDVPAGSYAVNATVQLLNDDDDDDAVVSCSLLYRGVIIAQSVEDVLVEDNGGLVTDDEDNRSESFPFQTALSDVSGGTITLKCSNSGNFDSSRVLANNAVITAIRVSSFQ